MPATPHATDDRPTVLDRLRARLARLEAPPTRPALSPLPLAPAIDRALPWRGLCRGALHEIVAVDEGAGVAFACLVAARAGPSLGWIATRPDGVPLANGIPVSIVWWLLLTAIATWVLLRTRVGNWIFACGGDANAARNIGVPVAKVKIGLFMFTAVAATIFALVQTLSVGSADVLRGQLKEFEAIIAAVIGGCLLTGGYGSAIGATFGALIFGTVQMGIFYTGVNTDWFKVFLGVMLLVAVLFNNYVRRKATEGR
jgi:ribose/xylose/arabinose/galactoside ABC-type transport system permease subunit